MIQDLKEVYKELEKIFGMKQIEKVISHVNSLERKIEDLIKSRDNWKKKYMEESK
jgi:hypothetical protein